MTHKEIVQQVEDMLRPIAARLGLEMVGVSLAGEAHRTVLRVLMDRLDGGITVEECAKVSETLSRQLDLYDLFDHPYTLEVSSPGLDRPLRTDADFRGSPARRRRSKHMAQWTGSGPSEASCSVSLTRQWSCRWRPSRCKFPRAKSPRPAWWWRWMTCAPTWTYDVVMRCTG